jgi:hypothetical protein
MPSDQRTSIHLPESLRVHAFRGVHPFPHSLNPSCMSTNPRAFPSEAKLQRVNSHGRFAIARRAGSLRRSTHARERERGSDYPESTSLTFAVLLIHRSRERERGRGSIWAESTVARPLLISPTRSCAFLWLPLCIFCSLYPACFSSPLTHH